MRSDRLKSSVNKNRRQKLNMNIYGIYINLFVPCINYSLFNITIVVYTLSDGNVIYFSVQDLMI